MDSKITYTTKIGDTVDALAYRYYGSTSSRTVEKIFEANPGLAKQGLILAAGVRIVLPEIQRPVVADEVRLWD